MRECQSLAIRSSGMWNPWGDLRHLVEVTLMFEPLVGRKMGRTCFRTSTITLDSSLLQRERNDALAHERIHLERGPAVVGFEDADERAVQIETARRLIPIGALCQALRWTRNVRELAEELHCTPETVVVRMTTMKHASERAAVRRVLDDVDIA